MPKIYEREIFNAIIYYSKTFWSLGLNYVLGVSILPLSMIFLFD